MSQKVIIVDHRPSFRNTLKEIINNLENIELIAEASNENEFLQVFNDYKPDIVLLDIKTTITKGLNTLSEALKIKPDLIVIGISSSLNHEFIKNVIRVQDKEKNYKSEENCNFIKHIIKQPKTKFFFINGN